MHTARSFFFQAEAGIRDYKVTGVQTCALPISDNRTPLEPTSVSSPNSIPLTSCSITAMWRASASSRSEERRVGKECRSGRSQAHSNKTIENRAELGGGGNELEEHTARVRRHAL